MSMHRPVVVGVVYIVTSMRGSESLPQDATRGITDTEDLIFRDAGELVGPRLDHSKN